jgi:hypothetical protein
MAILLQQDGFGKIAALENLMEFHYNLRVKG